MHPNRSAESERGVVNRAAIDDDQSVPGPQRNAFMPRYDFILRDDELDIELPITIYSEEPLGFDLSDGAEPNEAQLEILIEAACSGGLDLPEVTDAFEEVRNCLFDYMAAGVGEWDDESARRLGRLIGLASYFDAGVNIWIEHWSSIAAHADSYAGLVYLEDGREDGDIVARMKSALGDETLKILRRIDTKTDINEKSMLDFNELR